MARQSRRGLLIVYTGDGKGKTSAALGTLVRAVGYDWRACLIQFIKGSWYYGELDGLKRLAPNVELGYAFGSSPTLWTMRPGVTWYMPVPVFRPYVGTYYTHWFVGDGLADQNGIGGRAGLSLGRVLSLGVIYEHALGCSTNCDSWAPQLSAGYAF